MIDKIIDDKVDISIPKVDVDNVKAEDLGNPETINPSNNIDQLIAYVEDDKAKIATELGVSGEKLEKDLDDYLVEKAETSIEESHDVEHNVGEAIVRSLDEEASNAPVNIFPIETIADDGFEQDVNEVAESIDKDQKSSFRRGVHRILESIKMSNDDRMLRKASRIVRADQRKYDQNRLPKLIDDGVLNLDDERMRSLYMSTIKSGHSGEINVAIKSGITVPELMNNERIVNLTINNFISSINMHTAYPSFENGSFPYSELIAELIKIPGYNERIKSSINANDFGKVAFYSTMESFANYDTQDATDPSESNKAERAASRQESLRNIELFKKLGFEPLADDESISKILKSYRTDLIQKNLAEYGFANESVVDRMYLYKWNLLKGYAHTERYAHDKVEKLPNIFTDFKPSEDNEMANYWRNQSIGLGRDAMNLVMTKILPYAKNHDYFGEYSDDEAYNMQNGSYGYSYNNGFSIDKERANFTLFDNNGMPTSGLFSIDSLLFGAVKNFNYEGRANNSQYYKYDEDIMSFLSKNIDRIEGDARGFVKTWGELPDSESRLIFMFYATDGHNMREYYFDENGVTDKFYKLALFNKNAGRILPYIDANWESYYSGPEISYIKFLNKYNLNFNDVDFSTDLGQDIVRYFDETGPKKILAEQMFNDNINCLNKLIEIPELNSMLSSQQRQFLECSRQIEYRQFILDIRSSINDYFAENEPTPKLWQLIFTNGQYDYILSKNEANFTNIGLSKKQQDILIIYRNVEDAPLKRVCIEFTQNNFDSLSDEKIDLIPELLDRLSTSNAIELFEHRVPVALLLLNSNNPIGNLEKIEQIFMRNVLPFVGKAYSVFNILHPESQLDNDFHFNNSKISPVLRSEENRSAIIFSDLLRCAFDSNNRSLKEFLSTLEQNQSLIDNITSGEKNWESLNDTEIQQLEKFFDKLGTIYSKTQAGADSKVYGDESLKEKLVDLIQSFGPNARYGLSDRIVRMFAYPIGIHNLEEAKKHIDEKIEAADKRNREAAKHSVNLNEGDFIKGINSVVYLQNILQNGSVAKEYLSESAGTDATPLDTDLCVVLGEHETINSAISNSNAYRYGPTWIILKRDDRFTVTRIGELEADRKINEPKYQKDKIEAFFTGAVGTDHYGIRTGFASTEINYIVTNENYGPISLEIVRNGFYIPIVDRTSGKILFSPSDYDKLRAKMSGLSYYGSGPYKFADQKPSTAVKQFVEKNKNNEQQTAQKRAAINRAISETIASLDLSMKEFDGSLMPGVELIDTGSTGRNTNMPGDGDFDFMMRVDRLEFLKPEIMKQLSQALLAKFSKGSDGAIAGGNLRLKNCVIEGLDKPVDIDITFVEKTNKLSYTTEQSLKDRLSNIKEQSPSKYQEVIANILLAKSILKDAGAYKPNRGEVQQGGLGGVGVENWILQNGGSLELAAIEFLNAAKGKTFEEFVSIYKIWDFGENHLAARYGNYPHDEFVSRNMEAGGFERMKEALEKYLASLR